MIGSGAFASDVTISEVESCSPDSSEVVTQGVPKITIQKIKTNIFILNQTFDRIKLLTYISNSEVIKETFFAINGILYTTFACHI